MSNISFKTPVVERMIGFLEAKYVGSEDKDGNKNPVVIDEVTVVDEMRKGLKPLKAVLEAGWPPSEGDQAKQVYEKYQVIDIINSFRYAVGITDEEEETKKNVDYINWMMIHKPEAYVKWLKENSPEGYKKYMQDKEKENSIDSADKQDSIG